MKTCLVVDDHPLTMDGTSLALRNVDPGLTVHQAPSLAAAIATLASLPAIGLVLLDLDLQDSSGVDTLATLTRWCADNNHDARVVVLSGHAEPDLVRAVVGHFGTGFILKATSREIFHHAISLTLAGGVFIPDVILRRMAAEAPCSAMPPPPLAQNLSQREREIASLLVQGFTYKRIARELERLDGRSISEHTVRAHVGNIAWKLGVTENAKSGVMAEIARRGLTFPRRA